MHEMELFNAANKDTPLQDILNRFIGMTYREVDRQTSFLSLYIMNKFGVGGYMPELDKTIQNFVHGVVGYFNEPWMAKFKSIKDQTREPTEEAKQVHGYDEYHAERRRGTHIIRKMFKTKDEAEKARLRDEKRAHDIELSKLPWAQFCGQVNAAHREIVAQRDSHVITAEDAMLKDTPVGLRLQEIYDKLVELLSQQRR